MTSLGVFKSFILHGFDISIEQPKGSVRSGTDANGKKWESKMNNTYGYIRGTEGRDQDHIDVFIGENPLSEKVFVVDQVNPGNEEFDEHKVMLGFNSIEEARKAYLSNYEKGWQGLGNITETNIEDFHKWVEMEGRRIKPFSEYKSVHGNNVRLQAEQTEDPEAVNERFNQELESLTVENANSKVLYLGNPSGILLSTGIESKLLKLYGNKVAKKAKKHGFNFADIKDLPKAIANPIAIFKGSQKGSFSILTELNINGNNVLASLEVGKDRDIDFNLITSIYGKVGKGVIDWINNGKLLYSNKEKTLDYLGTPALIAGAVNNQELDSATKIVQGFENPKLPGEKMHVSDKKMQPVSRKVWDRLIKQLKKSGMARNIVTDKAVFERVLQEKTGKPINSRQGENYGFVTPEGDIYIDPDRMNANTPIHEFGHLWNTYIQKYNKPLWRKGVELAKQSA